MKTPAIYQSSATYVRIKEDTIFIRERKEKILTFISQPTSCLFPSLPTSWESV